MKQQALVRCLNGSSSTLRKVFWPSVRLVEAVESYRSTWSWLIAGPRICCPGDLKVLYGTGLGSV